MNKNRLIFLILSLFLSCPCYAEATDATASSGGSALDPRIQDAFRGLGLDLYQGYGLTEAAPVLVTASPSETPFRLRLEQAADVVWRED